MTRISVPASISSGSRALRRFGRCVITLAFGLACSVATAQFNGNPGTDLLTPASPGSTSPGTGNGTDGSDAATTRLQQPSTVRAARPSGQPEPLQAPAEAYRPNEFEAFVQTQAGVQVVKRFGANLLTDPLVTSVAQDPLPSVPADYIVRPGDEILLTVWGTVDADLRLIVDRGGRISVPRVGTIDVAGLKNADLAPQISKRMGEVFKNFKLNATMGQVRAIRVFVGGYVEHPGSITVNGLSSVLHAIMRTGGPSSAGSFRDIHLRRNGQEVAVFDLYDLLLKGDRNTDQLIQPDDIVFVGPVGIQVGILGSVNQPAIYELKPGQTLADALQMAGGLNAVADRTRVAIERLADRANGHVAQLSLPAQGSLALATGDIVTAFSSVTAAFSQGSQNERIHVEGEVAHPGDYILPPGSHIADALRAAGGMTSTAYPFGTELTREGVRITQQANYERALRDLETDMSRTQASQRATSAEELNAQSASASANARLLDRLRQTRPNGRVVLQLSPDATSLPDLPLENGDSLSIPLRSSSVGVFGSVFNSGSFVFEPAHTTVQYLALAGGPTRGADVGSIFMLRANGAVVSARQGTSFWSSGNKLTETQVEPGDTLFVPEQLNKSTFVQDAKDWTQILYQFGLGLAGIHALGL